jgi:peptidoglycan hydrolase-like protein with peptidoglycan-binding domain
MSVCFFVLVSYSCAVPAIHQASLRKSSPSLSPSASEDSLRTTPQPDLAVRQVQGLLRERGYDPGPIDGIIGQKTRTALRQFQRDHNLPTTGRIDANVKATLLQ